MYVKASPVEWPALNPNCLSEIRLHLHTCFQIAEFNSLGNTLLMFVVAGVTWATFHSLGMIPLLKHSWNNLANGLVSSGAARFKTLARTESIFDVKLL